MTRTTPPRQERRQHQRWPLGHYLAVAIPQWDDFAVWGSDLSRGGIGLKMQQPVTIGDRFVLGLPDGDDPVEAEVCNVSWLEQEQRYTVGLRWRPRTRGARALLHRFLQGAVRS